MAITRKSRAATASTNGIDVEALINKGGSPAVLTPEKQQPEGAAPVLLRIPTDMLKQIDVSVEARPIRTPRHTWLLEAIHEKLQRETSA
jgi:hypothetical protein